MMKEKLNITVLKVKEFFHQLKVMGKFSKEAAKKVAEKAAKKAVEKGAEKIGERAVRTVDEKFFAGEKKKEPQFNVKEDGGENIMKMLPSSSSSAPSSNKYSQDFDEIINM